MTLRRVEIDLAVEREVDDGHGGRRRIRLVGRFAVDPPGSAPTPAELADAVAALDAELQAAFGGAPVPAEPTTPREDRPTAELIETYRPRQRELIDLLLDENEVTAGEAARLREYLVRPPAPSPDPGGVPVTERPIAAAPLANDRTPTSPRPVSELIRLYQIQSLKQAGAVRARRQISYEEYMSLKRHFPPAEPTPSSAGGATGSA